MLAPGWCRCTCGKSFAYSSPEVKKLKLHRCRKAHYEPADLHLCNRPATLQNSLFVILSLGTTAAHNQDRKLVESLAVAGVPPHRLDVVHGVKAGSRLAKDNGVPISGTGIAHFSFRWRWLPRVAELLQSNPVTSTVFLLEHNCILTSSLSLIMELVNSTDKPIVWPGFFKHQAWNSTQGSKMVAFRADGLELAHDAVHKTQQCYHIDGVLSRRVPSGSIFVPKKSFCGFRSHDSVTESKKHRLVRRPGFKPMARQRDDIVERKVSKVKRNM